MTEGLAKKVREVEEEHFEAINEKRIAGFKDQGRDNALEFRGAFKAIHQVARNLNAQLISGLILIEEHKHYKHWGFKEFSDFLNSDEVPDVSKSTYYRLRPLYMAEGPERFDVYSSLKIPYRIRQLLLEHGAEITLDGGELVTPGGRVSVNDTAAARALIEAFADAIKERDGREEKKDKTIESQTEKIKLGVEENADLQRRLDLASQLSPYDAALLKALVAMINLTNIIGKTPEDTRRSLGENAMPQITEQWFRVRDAFGMKISLGDDAEETRQRVAQMKPVEQMTDEEKAETFNDRAFAIIDAEDGFDDLD